MKELEHHCPSDSHDKSRVHVDWIKQEDESITASEHLRQKIAEAAIKMSENESDEEVNNPTLEEILRSDVIDSDSENMDSDQDDPLRHAGVYTAEEVSLILRDKMLRLQSLYIDQFKHLQYLFKEKYKKYIQALQVGNEFQSVAHDSSNHFTMSSEELDKLKALMRYHRYNGQEILLKDKLREKRRAFFEGDSYKPKNFTKCIYNKDEVCQNRAIPLSHYCRERKLSIYLQLNQKIIIFIFFQIFCMMLIKYYLDLVLQAILLVLIQ